MKSAARRAVSALALLVYLPLYIAAATTLGDRVNGAPAAARALFYAAAGLAWVIPLYPLFVWMRAPRPQVCATDAERRGRE